MEPLQMTDDLFWHSSQQLIQIHHSSMLSLLFIHFYNTFNQIYSKWRSTSLTKYDFFWYFFIPVFNVQIQNKNA